MPDLETLLRRPENEGARRLPVAETQDRLAREMWRHELLNLKLSALGLGVGLAGLALVGLVALLVSYAFYTGFTFYRKAFPYGRFWVTYWAVILTFTAAAAILRPRRLYGIGRGPFTITEDPLSWSDKPAGEWAGIGRALLLLPNLIRMALFNLLSFGAVRRVKTNGDLALFILLAADRRIVAEEVLIANRKKEPHDLWSVVGALERLELLRTERLRHELVVWRSQTAERMLGVEREDDRRSR